MENKFYCHFIQMPKYKKIKLLKTEENISLIKRIALTDCDIEVRAKAVAKIDDEDFLYTIAICDNSPIVRHLALEKIKDENLIEKIIITNENINDFFMCNYAIKISSSKNFLEFIKNKSRYSNIKELAQKKLDS